MTLKDPDIEKKIRLNGHPLRQNNYEVAEMYDAYQDGMSLERVAKLYGRTRQAVYDVFRTRGYKLRKKKHKGKTEALGTSWTLDGAGFLRGTLDGRRTYLHKEIWIRANGPFPAKHVLIHRDGDKLNNTIENLELLPMSEMQKRFNPTGRNQFSA